MSLVFAGQTHVSFTQIGVYRLNIISVSFLHKIVPCITVENLNIYIFGQAEPWHSLSLLFSAHAHCPSHVNQSDCLRLEQKHCMYVLWLSKARPQDTAKGQIKSKCLFKLMFPPKNKQTNSTLLIGYLKVDLLLFIF